jgi:hypothetical protein
MYPQWRVTKPTVFSLLSHPLKKLNPHVLYMEYIAVSYTRDRFYLFFLFTVVNVEKFFRRMGQNGTKKGIYD